MIVAMDDTFPYTVSAEISTWEEWDELNTWANLNDIAIQMSFGKVWFEREEDVVAFRLRFGL